MWRPRSWFTPSNKDLRTALGSPGWWDRIATRWLISRAGVDLNRLAGMKPAERKSLRSYLRRDFTRFATTFTVTLFGLTLVAWILARVDLAVQIQPQGDGEIQAWAGYALIGLAIPFFLGLGADRLYVFSRTRWGHPDRQVGVAIRLLLAAQGAERSGGCTRQEFKRLAFDSVRNLSFGLHRAGCDARAVERVVEALDADVDVRDAVRAIAVGYVTGGLHREQVQFPPVVRGLLAFVPGWAKVVTFLGLVLGAATQLRDLIVK